MTNDEFKAYLVSRIDGIRYYEHQIDSQELIELLESMKTYLDTISETTYSYDDLEEARREGYEQARDDIADKVAEHFEMKSDELVKVIKEVVL